jgi:hypothetical protein
MTVKKDGDFGLYRESLYGIDLEGVDLVVTGVPLDTATTNRPGARFGPRGIRAASASIAWMRPYDTKVDPFEKLAVIDYGDCFFDFGLPDGVPDAIEAHASSIIDAGPGLLTLGGDHFIAWPLLKAHAKKHGKPLSLLHFDAHSDTWEDEERRVDHGTMFWHAAKEGLVDPAHSVQIGLRTTNDDTLGFNILDGPWVHENGKASRRPARVPEFRHRLSRPEFRTRNRHTGLRRANDAPGYPDYPRPYRHQPDRHGPRRGSADLRRWRNHGTRRRDARGGNDQHLRKSSRRLNLSS